MRFLKKAKGIMAAVSLWLASLRFQLLKPKICKIPWYVEGKKSLTGDEWRDCKRGAKERGIQQDIHAYEVQY